MTMDLSKLSNFLSRKLAALILLGVLLYEAPDYGHPGVVIAKLVVGGVATIVYVYCNYRQNVAEMQYLKTDPDLTEGDNGKTK